MVDIVKLANGIGSYARSQYVPFQGFNENVIVAHVQKHLDVERFHVLCALEYLANK